ncbi:MULTISPECIES: hypothetical protein [Yersinia]|uniref:hypothetical protein n=1 Tax=Yersinia TaxID=629 RepID=UPI001643C7A8|nr:MULTISPECIES: hypothetical protein [Yersinia]MDA5543118.1 hypothetical protein [Yersinia rochesterensis]MDN0105922.1 hypothetical protein [Yersinia rochesterensis]UZM77152.1 hypothetical protein OP863_03705 [Yersinia sp. SCPM-O-B-9106 (C-191)]
MLIKCTSDSVNTLPLSLRCMGETENTDFSFLNIGHEYVVYGVMFFPCRLDYLVSLEGGNPVWIPSDFFEIIDSTLYFNWSICITQIDDNYRVLHDSFKIQALIGYSELVTSMSHYTGILERESEDLRTFFEEKKKIDEWQLTHY